MSPTVNSFSLTAASGVNPWRTLEALCAYRAALSVALLALANSEYRPPYFGTHYPHLLEIGLYSYLFAAALLFVVTRGRNPNPVLQMLLQIAVDASAILCLVHSCGGVASGLGALLLTPVIAGSLTLPRTWALATPAALSLGMFVSEAFLQLNFANHNANFSQNGVLGAMLFLVAAVGSTLARRAQVSEARFAEAESNLEQLAKLSESIIHKMQAGVLVVDDQRLIKVQNHTAQSLLGRQAVGSNLRRVAPSIDDKLQQWLNNPAHMQNTALDFGDHGRVWVQFTALGGERSLTLIVLDDASRVSEQAQALKLTSLGRLTASIAHEIRNPLAAIQHASELLTESPELSETDRNLIHIVHRQGERINGIITTVLSLSRKSPQTPSHYRLSNLLADLVADFESSHHDLQTDVEWSINPDDICVQAEPIHVSQVLSNLLENAQTHAGPKTEQLKIHISAQPQGEHHVALDVRDNGPGIPSHIVGQVFEPFFSTRHDGTGLGLFITRELCEATGGTLTLQESETGAHFRVILPSSHTQNLQAK